MTETPFCRAYLSFPWPHLYQHPTNIVTIAIERTFQEQDAIFFVHLPHPEKRTLLEIDAKLRRYKDLPLDQVSAIRRALRSMRWPRPLRRFLWWFALNVSGRNGLTSSGLRALRCMPVSALLVASVVAADDHAELWRH